MSNSNNPEFSNAPKTAEERKDLHHQLVEFARIAVQTNKTKGLAPLIRKLNDSKVEDQINTWLQLYTPIKVSISNDGRPEYRSSTIFPKDFDLTSASLEPYYSVEPNIQEISPKKVFDRSLHTQKHNLSDREFQKKIIRAALEEALKDPSDITKNKVIGLLKSFDKAVRKGSPTVSGGLPGLGKHR